MVSVICRDSEREFRTDGYRHTLWKTSSFGKRLNASVSCPYQESRRFGAIEDLESVWDTLLGHPRVAECTRDRYSLQSTARHGDGPRRGTAAVQSARRRSVDLGFPRAELRAQGDSLLRVTAPVPAAPTPQFAAAAIQR